MPRAEAVREALRPVHIPRTAVLNPALIITLLLSAIFAAALLSGASDSNAWLPAGIACTALAAATLAIGFRIQARALWPLVALPACLAFQLLPTPARSIDAAATLQHLLRVIVYLAVFVVVRRIASEGPKWTWGLCAPPLLFACVDAVIGIAQHARGADHFATGTFADHSHFGGFMAMLLPVAIALAIHSRLLIAFTAPMLVFAALMDSVSRMAVAAALMAIFGMLILRTRRIRATLIVTVLALLAVIVLAPGALADRFESISTFEGFRHDAALTRWRHTLTLAAARPIFGWGAGSYERAIAPYDRSEDGSAPQHACNDYLQLLTETGMAGLTVVLTLFALALRRCAQAARFSIAALGCAGAVIALLAHSIFEFQMYIPANVLAVAWLAAVGCGACDFTRTRAGFGFNEWLPPRAALQSFMRRIR